MLAMSLFEFVTGFTLPTHHFSSTRRVHPGEAMTHLEIAGGLALVAVVARFFEREKIKRNGTTKSGC